METITTTRELKDKSALIKEALYQSSINNYKALVDNLTEQNKLKDKTIEFLTTQLNNKKPIL